MVGLGDLAAQPSNDGCRVDQRVNIHGKPVVDFFTRCVTHPPPRPGLLELCGGHAFSKGHPSPRTGLLELRVTLIVAERILCTYIR